VADTLSKVCPFEARVWVDDELLAVSSAALQVEGAQPLLCFPERDLRGAAPDSALLLPAAAAGYVAFDHTNPRVRVRLVDDLQLPDATERDRTLKRFPAWGDASDLLDMLDVRPAGDGSYLSTTRGQNQRGVVEASQMLAQSIVAAGRHAPGRRAVHASMIFMRAANVTDPLRFQLKELSGGKSFSSLAVSVLQGEKLCASGTLLLDVTAPDVIRHAAMAPVVAGPYASEPYDMSVTGRDLRFVDNAYTGDPEAPVGPPHLDAWLRYRQLTDDPYLNAALLVQFTGHVSIAASMRPHAGIGQSQAHRTLSTAINAIYVSLHADVRADEWMLYRHLSSFAGDGMTHSECRVHNQQGALLASFCVDAMVRRFAPERAVNDRTSL
jgi:acyl-CoA thioesterase